MGHLVVETVGAERTTIIVDIFDIIQQARDTCIHLKVTRFGVGGGQLDR